MNNQHAGLSQTLAEQRSTRPQEQATRQRPLRAASPAHLDLQRRTGGERTVPAECPTNVG